MNWKLINKTEDIFEFEYSRVHAKEKKNNFLLFAGFFLIAIIYCSFFQTIQHITVTIAIYLIFFFFPQLIIHRNYYANDKNKKVVFDYKNNSFTYSIKGKSSIKINIDSIKAIYYMRGRKDDSYAYSLPHMHYHYYKICTENEVFVFTDLVSNKIYHFEPKRVKISPFNLINHKNNYLINLEKNKRKIQEQHKQIEENKKEIIETINKFKSKYGSKSKKQLNDIVSNHEKYEEEAVTAAKLLLKEK